MHEALLGRPTLPILRSLGEAGAGSDDGVASHQARLAAELVEHARSHVPYWRERRDAAPAPPVLTRSEIQTHRESMRWRGAPERPIRHASSGTTGDDLRFYIDRRRQAWYRALRIRALDRLGVALGERQLHFWPCYSSDGAVGALMDAARVLRDRLTNDIVFDPRPLSAPRLDAALALLERYRPALIVGFPSWLFALAEHARRSGWRRRGAQPRLALGTGEILYDFQRRAIEAAFGGRVVEEYGSQDVGLIASEDGSGVLRVNWEHVWLEVLRDSRTAAPGEMGEIVATNLQSHVMPFIRYATGDVVRAPGGHAGGEHRVLTTLPPIEGRASDLLVATDGSPHSNRELVEALVRETGVTEFGLHQTAPDAILCMTVREGGWSGQEAKVEELLRSLLGRSLRLEWRVGGAFRPLKSGKRRYVCSPVAQSLLAHDRESGMAQARTWPQRVLDEA